MGDCGASISISARDYLFNLVLHLCLLFFSGVLLGDLLSPGGTFKKLKQAGFWFSLCVRNSFPNPMTLYTGFTNNRMADQAANHSSKRLLAIPALQRGERPASVLWNSLEDYPQKPETGKKIRPLQFMDWILAERKGLSSFESCCLIWALAQSLASQSFLADLKLVLICIFIITGGRKAAKSCSVWTFSPQSPSTVLWEMGKVQMHRWLDWQTFPDWQLKWWRGPAGFPGISQAELEEGGGSTGHPSTRETHWGLSVLCFIRHVPFTPKAVLSSSGPCRTKESPALILSWLFEDAFADPGPCLPESLLILY